MSKQRLKEIKVGSDRNRHRTNRCTRVATAWGTRGFYVEDPDDYIIGFGGRVNSNVALLAYSMKYGWIVFSSFSLAMLSSCRHATQQPSQTLSPIAVRIESVLPPNWALEEKGQEIMIGRQEPITRYTCVAMDVSDLRNSDTLKQYVNANGVTDRYEIRLRRATLINVSEFQRLKAVNDQIVVTKSTPLPNRKFLEDDAIRSFDSRYRELPEYYDGSYSIYLETNLGPYECIYPNAVARECEGIREKLDSLFNRYSSDTYPRTLGRGID
jgi:hypothetical protein